MLAVLVVERCLNDDADADVDAMRCDAEELVWGHHHHHQAGRN